MERLLSLRRDVSGIASPPRNTDYKKKGNGIDKRAMRLHRRSIDQRKMRDMTLLKQRKIEMSPLKEVQNKKPEPQKTAGKQKQQTEMKDRLKKWKEEKELKKKLQRQKQAPLFKVHHIQYEKPPINNKQKKEQPQPPKRISTRTTSRRGMDKPQPQPARSTRTTRSSSAKKSQQAQEPQVSSRVTRSTKMTQKVQEKPKTTSTRTSRRGKASQPPTSQPQQPTRSTRSSSAKRSQQAQEEPQQVSSHATRSTKITQKTEEPMKTANNFNKSSINFERGEPTMSFLEGASFAPVNFKFDFTMGLSAELNGSSSDKTPARRCSSTPLTKLKMGRVSNLPTPQGLSAIRPQTDTKAPSVTDKPLPVLCMSSESSVPSPQSSAKIQDNLATFMVSHAHVDNLPIVESPLESTKGTVTDVFDADSLEAPQTVTAKPKKIEETDLEDNKSKEEAPTDAEEKTQIVKDKKEEATLQTTEEKEVDEKDKTEGTEDKMETSIKEASVPVVESNEAKEEEKDVPYFRRLLCSETEKLTTLCTKWQGVMDGTTLSDDTLGELRSTVGKAQLLMDQRFKQFSGLVDNCEFNLGEKKTHCTDLIGFWEMVAYQVEDVEKMFGELDKLQANNWVKVVTVNPQRKLKKTINKKTQKPKSGAVSKKFAAERNAARQRLMAAKAAMQAKATRSKDNEKVVFEGGFFKVESPVRSPKVHCEAGSPLSAAFLQRTSNTPGSKPGSRQGTPRSQTFTPRNPRLSLQSKLCTPLSKLVLTETNSTTTPSRNAITTPGKDATTTPGKNATITPARITRSRQGTPVCTAEAKDKTGPCTPLLAKIFGEEVKTPKSCTKPTDLPMEPLIPGVNSPHIADDNIFPSAASIFTPPPKTTPPTNTSNSAAVVSDLICLDSPIAPSMTPDAMGSLKCFAAINATPDMKELLGTDVIMSPVRRSARRHHASGSAAQIVVEKLAEMPDEMEYGYQPNVSLL